MAQQIINLGTPPRGTDGDTLRQAFEKVQANTTELYETKQDGIEGLTPAGIAFLQAGDSAGQRDVIGLGNVTNTADIDKPVSAPQQEALDGKVDKVDGYGLSQNDLTDALHDKLSGIEGTHFRGQFLSLAALQAAIPSANLGDYANVDPGTGEDVQRALWDSDDSEWVITGSGGGQMTPAQIKEGLLANPDTNVLTDSQLAKLNAAQTNAYLLNRANHTGTQLASTISDLAAAIRGTLLTGLTAGSNAAIAATDTLLGALAKLQAQIASKLSNPMTAPGDLIVGGPAGGPSRLPVGGAGEVLRVNNAGTGLEFSAVAATSGRIGSAATGSPAVPAGSRIPFADFSKVSADITYNSTSRRFTINRAGTYRLYISGLAISANTRLAIGVNTETPNESSASSQAFSPITNMSIGCEHTQDLAVGDFVVFFVVSGGLFNQDTNRFGNFSITRL